MLPTFRTRITGVSSLAVALLLALAFGVIYVVVRESSYSHLDEDISAEYEEALNNLDWADDSLVVRHMPEWEEAEHQQIEVNPTFVQVVDRKGMLRFKSANLRQARFLYRADASSPVFFNDTINSKWLRLGQFPLLNDAGRPLGYVTIGISGDEAHAVLTRLRWTLGLSFAAVVLILFGVLWYAASVAIYPIRRLIAGTEALDEKDLQARLTVPTQVHETEQLAQAMNALLDRLELNMRQQKQFVADVSHELRTPLT
ncbi:MAG TPA: HAMP domain-containing protein, partial [Saprospiraceae bacterium]|nr:HAMP domain-containing protein [Saprospiraceae bacterium]